MGFMSSAVARIMSSRPKVDRSRSRTGRVSPQMARGPLPEKRRSSVIFFPMVPTQHQGSVPTGSYFRTDLWIKSVIYLSRYVEREPDASASVGKYWSVVTGSSSSALPIASESVSRRRQVSPWSSAASCNFLRSATIRSLVVGQQKGPNLTALCATTLKRPARPVCPDAPLRSSGRS